MRDIYTPLHGKWEYEELFRAAKIIDMTAKRGGMTTANLMDNLSNRMSLYEMMEALLFVEQALGELSAGNIVAKKKELIELVKGIADKVFHVE